MRNEIFVEGERVRLSRIFKAKPERVFGWWASPEKLERWSSCEGATDCRAEMDFRVGGRFVQRMTVMKTFPVEIAGTYLEIEANKRIVYEADFQGEVTKVEVEFNEVDEGTQVTLTLLRLGTDLARNSISRGMSESWDKLATLLDS